MSAGIEAKLNFTRGGYKWIADWRLQQVSVYRRENATLVLVAAAEQ